MEEYAYYLGLKPFEFMCMTPFEFEKWSEQQKKRIEDENYSKDYRLATLMAHLCNVNSSKKGKKYKASDFIKTRKKQKKSMSPEMMAEILKAVCVANGGEIIG